MEISFIHQPHVKQVNPTSSDPLEQQSIWNQLHTRLSLLKRATESVTESVVKAYNIQTQCSFQQLLEQGTKLSC